ncbi:T9SS type A sorting domain-containing protein [Hymenobacter terrigena]
MDIFIAKLVDTGSSSNYVWVKQAGGTNADEAFGVAVNGNNIYVAGGFYSPTVSFDNISLTNSGTTWSTDIFVAKLTDAGASAAFTWAVHAGGSSYDYAYSLAVRGPNLYLVGHTASPTATFGNIVLANVTNASGNTEAFLAKLIDTGSSGGFAWAKHFGGTGNDLAYTVTTGGTQVFVSGYVSPPATFDSLTISASNNNPVAFLASLTDPTLTATAAAQSSLPFTLSPNPARTTATLTLHALPGTATATLILRDALGRALRTETLPLPAADLRHTLDLTGLAPGLYAVQVLAGPAAATRRLVVE